MHSANRSTIKRAQKESLFTREISTLLMQVKLDHPELEPLFVNRVELSPNKGMLVVYFFTDNGPEGFEELFPKLVLFKPSMRKALAAKIPGRYTPDLQFKYDEQFEKQRRIEDVLNKLKDEEQSS